jgi:hypothetical protein
MILANNAELIIKNVGSDAPLRWRDKESGLSFVTSYCRLITALFNFSIEFIVDRYVSLSDFISSLDHDELLIPDDMSPDDLLESGWSMECVSCSGWSEGPVITIKVDEDDVSIDGDEVVFNFYFVHPYCAGFLNCDHCDRRLSGMLESEESWAYLRDAFEPQREFK